MPKRIFILIGHPDTESFNKKLAESYVEGARGVGHEVRLTNLGNVSFDPILHKGYREAQELEPDLKKIQEDITWCDHWVIFYPSWWSTMPAILKGMFDRIWLPGFAFHFHSHGYWWNRLLTRRTARVIVTSDSPAFISRLIFGDTTNEIKRGILWFAGIKARVKKIGGMKHSSDARKERLLKKARQWGREAY